MSAPIKFEETGVATSVFSSSSPGSPKLPMPLLTTATTTIRAGTQPQAQTFTSPASLGPPSGSNKSAHQLVHPGMQATLIYGHPQPQYHNFYQQNQQQQQQQLWFGQHGPSPVSANFVSASSYGTPTTAMCHTSPATLYSANNSIHIPQAHNYQMIQNQYLPVYNHPQYLQAPAQQLQQHQQQQFHQHQSHETSISCFDPKRARTSIAVGVHHNTGFMPSEYHQMMGGGGGGGGGGVVMASAATSAPNNQGQSQPQSLFGPNGVIAPHYSMSGVSASLPPMHPDPSTLAVGQKRGRYSFENQSASPSQSGYSDDDSSSSTGVGDRQTHARLDELANKPDGQPAVFSHPHTAWADAIEFARSYNNKEMSTDSTIRNTTRGQFQYFRCKDASNGCNFKIKVQAMATKGIDAATNKVFVFMDRSCQHACDGLEFLLQRVQMDKRGLPHSVTREIQNSVGKGKDTREVKARWQSKLDSHPNINAHDKAEVMRRITTFIQNYRTKVRRNSPALKSEVQPGAATAKEATDTGAVSVARIVASTATVVTAKVEVVDAVADADAPSSRYDKAETTTTLTATEAVVVETAAEVATTAATTS
jgi:hypothetical protein